ncbi:MAG: 2Fe-2S iron-sulfur cluster-binding protein [Pseudomonadota bacterium]
MNQVIHIDGSPTRFIQTGSDTVLRAALRAGIGFPYECNSGGCGSCKFEIVAGEVQVLWPEAPGLMDRDRRKGRHLACQCVATGELTIKVRTDAAYVPRIPPRRRRARLVGTTDVTHDIREFRFVSEGTADFLPGQYASVVIDGVGAPRAYSMSNLPNAEGEWHFQIRRVHQGQATTRLFHALQVGHEVEIDGPYGLAYLREDNTRDIVCVAGGSGLAPMVSIARGAATAGLLGTRKLYFFYGGRTPRDLCGEALLRELPGFGDAISYHPVISEGGSDKAAAWSGNVGFIHEWLPRVLGEGLAQYEFYFAGPPPMTQAIQEMLMVTYHVPFQQIHFDRFF